MLRDRDPSLSWTENGRLRQARWFSANDRRPPSTLSVVDHALPAERAVRLATAGHGLLWRGDYHQARQLLDAIARRTGTSSSARALPAAASFHRERQRRGRTARLLAAVLVELEPGGHLTLRRAPETAAAIKQVYGAITEPSLVSLRELLGVLNAHRQRCEGIPVAALDGARIHPHYGVFAPTRQDYLDLIARASLPTRALGAGGVAFDAGVGTGVLSALLVHRGVGTVTATDNQARAVACARDNILRLGLKDAVTVEQRDLFPAGRADLVVANPPWLPGVPASAIETGVYDRGGSMTSRFIAGLREHLRPDGEALLIQSTLPELLDLRRPGHVPALIEHAGLRVEDLHEAAAANGKNQRHEGGEHGPLAEARAREKLQLWRLRR